MKKYADTLQFFENEYSTLSQCERKKFFLRTRDRMYAKKNLENKYNYKDGTLDSTMIEIEVAAMLKADYYDIENIEFVEFGRRKLNFKKDSLREFLYVAAKELK